MKLGVQQRVRRTTVMSIACGAVLIGIALPYYGLTISFPLVWSIACFLLAAVFLHKLYLSLLLIIVGCIFVGAARGSVVFNRLQQYTTLFQQEVTLQGKIADDIGVNESRHQQEFHLFDIKNQHSGLPGRLQISTFDNVQLTRGDVVRVSGILRSSKGTSRQGTIRSAQVRVIRKTDSIVEKFRTHFFRTVKTILPEPHASLGLGYLVGLRASLPDEINDHLAATGLTHIIAVSGYNLTILIQATRRLFAKKSAYQSVLFAGFLLLGFVVIAGGSASISRAAVVCILGLTAWYYGREFKPVLLLLLSGLVTGLYNPLYIWGDPGWYLSFLAFAGILLLAPPILQLCFNSREPRLGVQILLETVCAQACTLPYTMYLFGGVSIIAPLANLLVLPLIPFIMIGVAAAGFLGMMFPGVATLLAILPSALLSLQLWIVKNLSILSWAHQEITISIGVMSGMFGAILFFIILLHRRARLEKIKEIEYTNSSSSRQN